MPEGHSCWVVFQSPHRRGCRCKRSIAGREAGDSGRVSIPSSSGLPLQAPALPSRLPGRGYRVSIPSSSGLPLQVPRALAPIEQEEFWFQSPHRRGCRCKLGRQGDRGAAAPDDVSIPSSSGLPLQAMTCIADWLRFLRRAFQSPHRRGCRCKPGKRKNLPNFKRRAFQSPHRRGCRCKLQILRPGRPRGLPEFQSPHRRGCRCKLRGLSPAVGAKTHRFQSPHRRGCRCKEGVAELYQVFPTGVVSIPSSSGLPLQEAGPMWRVTMLYRLHVSIPSSSGLPLQARHVMARRGPRSRRVSIPSSSGLPLQATSTVPTRGSSP